MIVFTTYESVSQRAHLTKTETSKHRKNHCCTNTFPKADFRCGCNILCGFYDHRLRPFGNDLYCCCYYIIIMQRGLGITGKNVKSQGSSSYAVWLPMQYSKEWSHDILIDFQFWIQTYPVEKLLSSVTDSEIPVTQRFVGEIIS